MGFPETHLVKNHLQCRRPQFNSWVRKIPWRRGRLPTRVFWPGEFHGLCICKKLDTTEWPSLVPYDEKGISCSVLVLEGLIGLHRTIWVHLFGISGWGIGLDYCDVEWFVLETKQDYSVVFEIVPRCCISDSLVDYEGCSISPKGFLFSMIDIIIDHLN